MKLVTLVSLAVTAFSMASVQEKTVEVEMSQEDFPLYDLFRNFMNRGELLVGSYQGRNLAGRGGKGGRGGHGGRSSKSHGVGKFQ